MKVKQFVFGAIGTNCYVVNDDYGNAFCVDIADSAPIEYFNYIITNNLKLKYLLITHGHYDHVLSFEKFINTFPDCTVIISETEYNNLKLGHPFVNLDFSKCKYQLVNDGDFLKLGDSSIKIIATPGHSTGCICYLIDDLLFCGDAIFKGSIGRTDLLTGDFTQSLKSIEKIKMLPDCKIFPGHMELTDLASEKKYNQFFRL